MHQGGGMTLPASPSIRERNRLAVRDTILDAAERLLDRGEAAEFSMRELAVEAGKGFVTPFNRFGSKGATMHALSGQVIDRMETRFRAEKPAGDAIDRTLAMGRTAAACLLERPVVYKAVVGSLGTAGPAPSEVRPRSRALWKLALGDMAGIFAGGRLLSWPTRSSSRFAAACRSGSRARSRMKGSHPPWRRPPRPRSWASPPRAVGSAFLRP
jgi:AcrR family transcriptional regulator